MVGFEPDGATGGVHHSSPAVWFCLELLNGESSSDLELMEYDHQFGDGQRVLEEAIRRSARPGSGAPMTDEK